MINQPLYDEQDILRRLASGEKAAFDQLFHLHWHHVYSAALTMTKSAELASDIAQDAFLDVWKNRQQMSGVDNVRGFLHNSARFLILKKLRRVKVEEAYTRYLTHKLSLSQPLTEQEQIFSAKQMRQSLERGIAELPTQQQRAFRLSRDQGLTHEQIGEVMGVSKKTVKDYIVRAIAYLKPLLEKHYGCISWGILILAQC